MTFPLGSLRGDGAETAPRLASSPSFAPTWREQALLLTGAVVWLLAVLALASHSAADPGFSTSGGGGPIQNRVGAAGAWLADVAFFLVGYSVWWAVLVGARAWLGALAHAMRATGAAPESATAKAPAWPIWLGLALL
ncbi:MAG TPA: DNA translocase FtsK 4TM domain-containing protein, partial [Caldimonas sp.]